MTRGPGCSLACLRWAGNAAQPALVSDQRNSGASKTACAYARPPFETGEGQDAKPGDSSVEACEDLRGGERAEMVLLSHHAGAVSRRLPESCKCGLFSCTRQTEEVLISTEASCFRIHTVASLSTDAARTNAGSSSAGHLRKTTFVALV